MQESWEATVTGGLQTGGFQMGHCNIENSALYFNWKRGISTLSKSKKMKRKTTAKSQILIFKQGQ